MSQKLTWLVLLSAAIVSAAMFYAGKTMLATTANGFVANAR